MTRLVFVSNSLSGSRSGREELGGMLGRWVIREALQGDTIRYYQRTYRIELVETSPGRSVWCATEVV